MAGYRRRSIPRTLALRSKWERPEAQTGLVRFRYADQGFDASTTVGNSYRSTYNFRGNGPYDPDSTGVGVQPYGWDYKSGAFTDVMVYASKITVRWNIADNSAREVVCTILPLIVQAPTSIDSADVRQIPKHRQTRLAGVSGITRRNTQTSYCSTKFFYKYTDTTLDGTFSAVPGQQWFWHVIADTAALGVEVAIYFDVEITYYCRLSKQTTYNES